MNIQAHSKQYQVLFENDFEFIEKLSKVDQSLWVIDEKVYGLYRDVLEKTLRPEQIMLIEAVETNKVIDTALEICERMTGLSGKRNGTIISMGGGIIQDITGFAANILYRGVRWTFIPTTLLAACDSCIGSKTSLNYKNYKNLLGTFYPPDDIYICPIFFRTLSEVDYYSGLGEVVKFNAMAGMPDFRKLMEDLPDILQRDEATIKQYVHKSLEFKKSFIEQDEYDRGVRIHLNFAHTFGHAFETVTEYAIPHGTAVAMGTIVADNIAFDRGWISAETKDLIESVLVQIIDIPLLQEKHGLRLDALDNFDGMLGAIRKDKKQIDDNLTAVLFENDQMDLKIIHDLSADEIQRAVAKLLERLNIK